MRMATGKTGKTPFKASETPRLLAFCSILGYRLIMLQYHVALDFVRNTLSACQCSVLSPIKKLRFRDLGSSRPHLF